MKKLVLLMLAVSLCSYALAADDQTKDTKVTDRVQAAADVLNEIESAPDSGIPEEILSRSECVAVVPSMLKGGFIVERSTVEGWQVAARRRDGARPHSLP